MKNTKIAIWLGLIPALLSACQKETNIPPGLSNRLEVTTSAVTSITQFSAVSGVQITGSFSQDVLNKGICWSTREEPTVSDFNSTGGAGTGSTPLNLTSLTPGTAYYIRSYAITQNDVRYGDQKRFVTQSYQLASVSTLSVTAITQTGATGGGNITGIGGGTISARGVCWSTFTNPTISNNRTTDGTGSGSYSSTLSNLSPGTLYYVRAYATNQAGTVYGAQVFFTTAAISLATVTTNTAGSITRNSAVVTGTASAAGGGTITSRGICWGTGSNPTLATAVSVSNGSGTGSISASLTGLSSGTTYYFRAYATNQAGTAYGSVFSFRTL